MGGGYDGDDEVEVVNEVVVAADDDDDDDDKAVKEAWVAAKAKPPEVMKVRVREWA